MPIDLFANGYYLGNAYYGNPWTTACDRSPDGLTLAFTSPLNLPKRAYLHWFRLGSPPDELQTYYDDPGARQFVFSPDSTRLAVFGQYDALKQTGSLYILTIDNKTISQLPSYADVKSLVWSPDGRYLAFIARYQASDYEDFMVVVDAQTGDVAYNASVDFEGNATPTWPTIEWGVEFPVEMDALEQCALPDAAKP